VWVAPLFCVFFALTRDGKGTTMPRDLVDTTPRRPGATPLAPRRDVKLQVCFSSDERARLERQARAAGFESVASYVRARTVALPDGVA